MIQDHGGRFDTARSYPTNSGFGLTAPRRKSAADMADFRGATEQLTRQNGIVAASGKGHVQQDKFLSHALWAILVGK